MSSSSQIHCGQCEKCGEYYEDELNAESEWCKPCLVKYLKENFANWTSGNKKIDNYIQETQLKIDRPSDIVFEWIPYYQFYNIIEDVKGDSANVYSAIWKNGPLSYNYFKKKLTRGSGKKVALKCLFNLQNDIDKFLSEVKTYSVNCSNNILKIYGITQNHRTKDYIMVLHNEYFEKYCKTCCSIKIERNWCNSCHINLIRKDFINCNSGNKEIDNYIQEMQLSISNPCTIVFEWIPYDQFYNINEIGKGDTYVIYTAMWKDGPLHYEYMTGWAREPNKKFALKCLQNATNEIFLNEVKAYSINYNDDKIIYGISQNPSTKVYVMVLQDKYHEKCVKCDKPYVDMRYEWYNPCHHFRNGKIDNFIQEMRLTINNQNEMVFEWMPYNRFNNIKKIGKGGFATVYSATWKDGPLFYILGKKEWIRESNKKVALKCLHNSQNISNEFLNEVKTHLKIDTEFIINIYGISQDPSTKDYILILDYTEGGNLNDWSIKNYKEFAWSLKLKVLLDIVQGLKEIHRKQIVHRDFHTGNILVSTDNIQDFNVYISDMGLSGEVDDAKETSICGVLPYMAPEVLKGMTYTQAADVYSFGMIMYYVATMKQPFNKCQHDENLILNIVVDGIRPEINEPVAPKCYIDLMKKCWDPNPDNRPNASEIEESINSFSSSEKSEKIKNQFEKSEKYRIANLENSFDSITDSSFKTHSGAVYTSRNFSFKISELPNMNDYDQNKGEIVQNNSLLIDFSKLDLYKSDVQNEGEEKFETM